jgi:hypothetical protein
MDQTNRSSTLTKTKTVLQHLFVLLNTNNERMRQEEIHLLAKLQPSSSHYIELSIVQKLDLGK